MDQLRPFLFDDLAHFVGNGVDAREKLGKLPDNGWIGLGQLSG